LNKEETPLHIELVHNTDDDTLSILLIRDPNELKVIELNLKKSLNSNWLLLKERYGNSSESLIENVESLFRTLEFYNLIKGLATIDKESSLKKA
jgi:hypothetical protein